MSRHIAIDLGASNGRIIAGGFSDESCLNIEEVYRFPNSYILRNGHLCWDNERLFENILQGLKLASGKYDDIESIAVDSWGVDFALVDIDGNIIGDTLCYRDARTEGVMEKVFSLISPLEHYKVTGIQQMSINTLFQLYSLFSEKKEDLEKAHRLLFTPDYYAWKLCGVMVNEYSIASTSELLDAYRREWDYDLINKLGFPAHIFGKIVKSGTILGNITAEVSERTSLSRDVKVIAACGHDTACAVASLGFIPENSAYLSSGTWSLLGIKTDSAILSEEAFKGGFTNEGGYGGSIRFLQNITGLWILQSLMKEWGRSDYPQVIEEARQSDISLYIDIDDSSLINPVVMERAVLELCKKRCSEELPLTQGDYTKIILLSLAHRYKKGLSDIENVSGRKIDTLYILGGGSKNTYLNELTEEITGRRVILGQCEATAYGNIIIQHDAI
jgi:rhamnulokinase